MKSPVEGRGLGPITISERYNVVRASRTHVLSIWRLIGNGRCVTEKANFMDRTVMIRQRVYIQR
jgi:hypothetical protein